MKHNYIVHIGLLFLVLPLTGFAQVGIGTTNPEGELHVAGDSATVRLEGLSAANDTLNQGTEIVPVYADKKGNLTLKAREGQYASSLNLFDASYVFEDKEKAENINANETTTLLYTYDITLPSEAFLEVKFSLCYSVYESYTSASVNTPVLDNDARQVLNYFTIDDEPKKYGLISQNYFNNMSDGARGDFYNNGFGYLALEPGTYTIKFYVSIAGDTSNETVAVFGGEESHLRIRYYQ